MDLHLPEKWALATGSPAGIGAAIARQLASEGVAVVVHGRDEQRGQRLANILESYLSIPVGHVGTTDDVARVVAFSPAPTLRSSTVPSYEWMVGVTPGRADA